MVRGRPASRCQGGGQGPGGAKATPDLRHRGSRRIITQVSCDNAALISSAPPSLPRPTMPARSVSAPALADDRAQRLVEGIPMPESLVQHVKDIAARAGVPYMLEPAG